jgi:GNAT superfamily N-acetyltransferase
LFVLNDAGRITSNREPGASRGPLFFLVRSTARCSWAIRADVPDALAAELDGLAREEPPVVELGDAPVHADRYLSVLRDRPLSAQHPRTAIVQSAGPAFSFPTGIEESTDVVFVEDERLLDHHFRGWVPGEIAAGSGPVAAIMVDGYPVSICFSARASDTAAEAGVETAERFRGRGLASRVIAAWALAVRASGRVPLYSTSWTNSPSLAVARKLGLIAYASSWSLSD